MQGEVTRVQLWILAENQFNHGEQENTGKQKWSSGNKTALTINPSENAILQSWLTSVFPGAPRGFFVHAKIERDAREVLVRRFAFFRDFRLCYSRVIDAQG